MMAFTKASVSPSERAVGPRSGSRLCGAAARRWRKRRFRHATEAAGRPFVAPPGVSAERLKILRDAFMATMKDPDYLREAKTGGLNIGPIDGEAVSQVVRGIYAAPPDVIAAEPKIVN